MAEIKHIIFDLGGVLYNIDYNETFRRLSLLLGINVEVGNWTLEFKNLIYFYETGSINTEQFLLSLQKMSMGKVPSDNDLVSAWNSMLIGWQDGVWEMLEELTKSYDLYILSNINDLHISHVEQELSSNGGKLFLYNFFTEIYLSHEIKLRKPDRRAFDLIIENNNLNVQHILYIDDFPKNITEAKLIGIQCVVHDDKKNIKTEVKKYLNFVC